MWDIKLFFFSDLFFLFNFIFNFIFNSFFNFLSNGFFFFNLKIYFYFISNLSINFAIKFLLSIGFLILIRGGTPRYRYDYLTKLGWLKFLGFIISTFFLSLLLFFIY